MRTMFVPLTLGAISCALLASALLSACSCQLRDDAHRDTAEADAFDVSDPHVPSCDDGVLNGYEEGVDCGGPCSPCEVAPTCADGMQNGDEEGVDCGGSCAACPVEPSCDDGVQNGEEEGVDCGGSCEACPAEPICAVDGSRGCNTGLDCRNMGMTDYYCSIDTHCCELGDPICWVEGQFCSNSGWATDQFMCDTEAGLCRRRCNTDLFEQDPGTECPTRSYCFSLSEERTTYADDGVCLPSDCESVFEDPICTVGPLGAITEADVGQLGTCTPLANGASFCLPAGDGGLGDPCGDNTACDPRLFCAFEGTCAAACHLRDDTVGVACAAPETCEDLLGATASNPAGLCAQICDPYSVGQCGDDQCIPLSGGEWICSTVAGTIALALGDDCDAADAPDSFCPEGTSCLNKGTEDVPDSACTARCDVLGDEAPCTGDGEVCQPSALEGLGFCAEGCEPYPRMGDGGYGCSEEGATCMPFDLDLDAWDEAQGACLMPFGDLEYGEICPGGADDNFTFGCTDLGLCLDIDFDANEEPFCRQLCDPYPADGVSECGDGETCSTLFVLFTGGADFGYCEADISDASFGEACTPVYPEGITPCADPGSLCIDTTGAGEVCEVVCRVGHGDTDCPGGGACSNPRFDPSRIPPYVGLCE